LRLKFAFEAFTPQKPAKQNSPRRRLPHHQLGCDQNLPRPRTLLRPNLLHQQLRRLLPDATLTIVDASDGNLEVARGFLKGHEAHVDLVHDLFTPNHAPEADLVVIPLSFMGDRRRLYLRPPAPAVFVHDWVWSRQGASAVVSWFLLKRLNLVIRA